jgi:hypothetical protein
LFESQQLIGRSLKTGELPLSRGFRAPLSAPFSSLRPDLRRLLPSGQLQDAMVECLAAQSLILIPGSATKNIPRPNRIFAIESLE